MMHRQHGIESVFEPLSGFMALTVWTMPVAAATIDQVVFAATFAAVDGGAEKIRAAVNDGLKGLAMIDGYCIGKAQDILGAVIAKNLLNCCHGQILSSAC
jgi:hypothetical protein